MLFKPRNQHANLISFFPVFQLRKKKQHAYTNIILTKKLHVIQTKKLTCKLDFFFPVFWLRKTTCIYQHHSHKKKKACYSNQEINMQTGFFFQFSSSEKQHAYTNIILTEKKNCMLFKPRNQHANWIFFPVFQLRKQHTHSSGSSCSNPQYKDTKPVLEMQILEPKYNQKTCHN